MLVGAPLLRRTAARQHRPTKVSVNCAQLHFALLLV
jgi:hypothetical protein